MPRNSAKGEFVVWKTKLLSSRQSWDQPSDLGESLCLEPPGSKHTDNSNDRAAAAAAEAHAAVWQESHLITASSVVSVIADENSKSKISHL